MYLCVLYVVDRLCRSVSDVPGTNDSVRTAGLLACCSLSLTVIIIITSSSHHHHHHQSSHTSNCSRSSKCKLPKQNTFLKTHFTVWHQYYTFSYIDVKLNSDISCQFTNSCQH